MGLDLHPNPLMRCGSLSSLGGLGPAHEWRAGRTADGSLGDFGRRCLKEDSSDEILGSSMIFFSRFKTLFFLAEEAKW